MASVTGGQIIWNLDVNKSKFDTQLRKASGDAKTLSSNLDKEGKKAQGTFGSMGSAALGFAKKTAIAAGIAAGATLVYGIKSAASFEQTRIGLENMLGSADKARSLLTDISKFAAETPFEFPELAQATRQLVAFGFTGKQAFSTMKQLGDVSAAVGAPINDLAYLMGTLRTQGRAFTIDIRQFAMRGIPIYEYLAKVLGKSTKEITKMIEEGKIGFPEVQKAFKAMTGEGGAFYKTMAKQSKSLSGLFSTLKDNLGFVLRDMIGIKENGDVVAGSVFDRLRNGLAAVIGFIEALRSANASTNPTIANFRNILTGIGNVIKYLISLYNIYATSFINTFKKYWEGLVKPALMQLWNVISTQLVPAMRDLWRQVGPVLGPALKALGVIIGVTVVAAILIFAKVVTAITKATATFWSWVAKLIAILKVVLGPLITLTNWINNKLIGAVKWAINWWDKLIQRFKIKDKITVALRGVYDAIVAPFRSAFSWIERKILDLLAKLGLLDKKAAGSINGARNAVVAGAKKAGNNAQGTNFWRGGPTWVGEKGPELVNLPRGSQVIPNHKLNGAIGGNQTSIANTIGNININNKSDADYLLSKLTREDNIYSMGLVT